jgi:predicted branched-subunit amino acid permease
MSADPKPFLDPASGEKLNRFASRKDAFWSGLKDASGAPAMVLFAGMVGFGAMGKTSGFELSFTTLSSLLMFALPGQVVLMEMMVAGSSLIAIALAVTLTSTRFITMTITLFPQLDRRDQNAGLYASVHLLAMTA